MGCIIAYWRGTEIRTVPLQTALRAARGGKQKACALPGKLWGPYPSYVPTQMCWMLVTKGKLNKLVLQVFEYLSTDLKKFMDRNGKGPNFPLDPRLIKVCCVVPRTPTGIRQGSEYIPALRQHLNCPIQYYQCLHGTAFWGQVWRSLYVYSVW